MTSLGHYSLNVLWPGHFLSRIPVAFAGFIGIQVFQYRPVLSSALQTTAVLPSFYQPIHHLCDSFWHDLLFPQITIDVCGLRCMSYDPFIMIVPSRLMYHNVYMIDIDKIKILVETCRSVILKRRISAAHICQCRSRN